jgi:hypothetical protein
LDLRELRLSRGVYAVDERGWLGVRKSWVPAHILRAPRCIRGPVESDATGYRTDSDRIGRRTEPWSAACEKNCTALVTEASTPAPARYMYPSP